MHPIQLEIGAVCGFNFYLFFVYRLTFHVVLLACAQPLFNFSTCLAATERSVTQMNQIEHFAVSLKHLGLPTEWMDTLPPEAIQEIVFDSDSNTQPEFNPNVRGLLLTACYGPKTRLTLPRIYESHENPGSIQSASLLTGKDIANIVHELWHAYWNWINISTLQGHSSNSPYSSCLKDQKILRASLETMDDELKKAKGLSLNDVSSSQGYVIFEEAGAEYIQALTIDMVAFQRLRDNFSEPMSRAVELYFSSRWDATRLSPQLGYSSGEAGSTGKVNLPIQIRSIIHSLLKIPTHILDLPLPNRGQDDGV